jgi:single stranded DNA-binding protein
MFNINTLSISGRLVRDPELHTYGTDGKVVSLRISHPMRVKDPANPGSYKTETHFFTVKAFGAVAQQMARQLTAKQEVVIEGELHFNEYVPRDGGPKRQDVEIHAERFYSGLTAAERDSRASQRAAASAPPAPAAEAAPVAPAPSPAPQATPAAPAAPTAAAPSHPLGNADARAWLDGLGGEQPTTGHAPAIAVSSPPDEPYMTAPSNGAAADSQSAASGLVLPWGT